jgi:hypothetical protein
MNSAQNSKRPEWDVRVQTILRSVRKRATILMLLGYAVYGGGSALILYAVKDKGFATVLVMYFFQLMVLYFGTKEMYPAIQGAFRVGIEANRDSVPIFEKLADSVHKLESEPQNHPLVKEVETKVRQALDERIMPVVDTWARIGERLEKKTIPEFEKMVTQLQDSEKKIDAKVSSTMEGVKRVQQQIEGEIQTGLFRDIREAAEAVKLLGMQHAAPPMPVAASLPGTPALGKPLKPAGGARDFSGVLASLNKKPNGAPAEAASQGGRS